MKTILRWTLLFALIFVAMPFRAYATETPPNVKVASYNTGVGHPACAGVTLETPSTPECDAFMASRPFPNVTQMPANLGIMSDIQLLRFNKKYVPVYNSPGGKFLELMHAGYSAVQPIQYQSGWVEFKKGRWTKTENMSAQSPSTFAGVTINGLDMPFAWIIARLYAVNSPNGTKTNVFFDRYQVVNIYATVNVSGWDWHLIGPGVWTNQKNMSIVYPYAPTEFGGNWVAVNLFEQNLVAYSGGTPVMATLVSSGVKNGKWDTKPGTFQVGVRVESGTMSGAEGQSDFYSLPLVPYAQYFNGLMSLHGTYWHNSFGYPHSHGCVNLTVTDAKWLFESWLGEGSTVYVYDAR